MAHASRNPSIANKFDTLPSGRLISPFDFVAIATALVLACAPNAFAADDVGTTGSETRLSSKSVASSSAGLLRVADRTVRLWDARGPQTSERHSARP
jgi:hypothetical protein